VTQIRVLVQIKMANLLSLNQKEMLAKQVAEQTRKLEEELARRRETEQLQEKSRQKLRESQVALLNILEDLRTENQARKRSEAELRASEIMLKGTAQKLRDLTTHIQEVREEERREIAQDLHDDLGQKLTALNIDLAWLARRIPEDLTMPAEMGTQVFRIVQEALTNIMRHAEASNVVISLIEKEKGWRSGPGFVVGLLK